MQSNCIFRKALVWTAPLLLGAGPIADSAFAQRVEPVQAIKPVRQVREALGISYPEGAAIDVLFQGTHRLPVAEGKAEVKREKGVTYVNLKVDEIRPAQSFGGDFSTYVLWTVSPEGQAVNAGELILKQDEKRVKATTPLQTFGMFVTAEPHFLVKTPSTFVVLETVRPKDNISGQMLQSSRIRYKGHDGLYEAGRETLTAASESDEKAVRSDMKQARVAVELAKRAGAAEYAAAELAQAEADLEKMVAAVEARVDERNAMIMGHRVVRKAVEAQELAEERSFQAALDRERKENADQISTLETAINDAQSEAERARLETERRQMQLQMEQEARAAATAEAEEAARRAREAEQLAMAARREAQQADAARSQAEAARTAAEQQAQLAQQEAALAREEQMRIRARMESALSKVVETRETARGLIVNLPDILFDFGKANLKPDAREKLSKVCGILLVSPGYRLAIEGHTDSVGSDEFNQKLSQDRASSVNSYLLECGLPGEEMTMAGFGESKPIATNDTNEGRQQNRRVEIVIQDDGAATEVSGLNR
jgi:outer membrane protein OmpA-like peptidoglycan-associated protein